MYEHQCEYSKVIKGVIVIDSERNDTLGFLRSSHLGFWTDNPKHQVFDDPEISLDVLQIASLKLQIEG